MRKTTLKNAKQLLMNMKRTILREINEDLKHGREGAKDDGMDTYDLASEERDREISFILNDREREKLRNIDEALLRIEEGEYGICEECGDEIPIGRLKVMPFARYCVRCKSDIEKMQAQTKRFEEDRAYNEISFGDEEDI